MIAENDIEVESLLIEMTDFINEIKRIINNAT